jgi:hypothetical protein
MKYVSNNPITNLLLASASLLALIITIELLLPFEITLVDEATGAVSENEPPHETQSRYVHPHISSFPEILSRPIFFSNREMPAQVVEKSAAPRTPLRLKLEGIAIATNTRVAVLRDLGNNQLVQLSVGMSHNNWQLTELTSSGATFRRGADDVAQLTLDLENQR